MRRAYRLLDVVVGLGYLVLVGALVLGALLVYDRTFADTVEVGLEVDTVGSALQEGSDVKLHGVPVGRVDDVDSRDGGAELALALEPDVAADLPAGTVARLLPKTLFGERYVALVPPAERGGPGLSDGDRIAEDTSAEAVALDQVLDELLPLLQSIQPEKLSATLGELSTMLRGQGRRLGDTLVAWSAYLERLNPLVPTMTEDFAKLAEVARGYDEAAPDLLNALDQLTVTSATMVAERSALRDAYARVTTAADTSGGWVGDHQRTIRVLSRESRTALEAARPYARQFPCLLSAAADFVPVMEEVLGAGTDEPGIHVRLNVVDARGKYLPGKDAPRYTAGGRPTCPYVTSSRRSAAAAATGPASAAAGRTEAPSPEAVTAADAGSEADPPAIPAPPRGPQSAPGGTDLGPENSAAENQLIAELVAPSRAAAPADYPRWASLLLGPLLRGAEVELR